MHYGRVFLSLGLLGAASCNQNDFGSGLGWPPSATVERPAPLPLQLTEIYVATSDSTAHFAELLLDAEATPLELESWAACWAAGCLSLAGQVVPGERTLLEIGALGLSPSAGELAIVDDEGLVRAYLAWGADPAVLRSSYAAEALLTGATQPGDFVPLPFPAPLGVAVANEAAARGCAVPSPGSAAAINGGLCAPQPSPLSITELLPALAEIQAGWVELTNSAPSAVHLLGVRLCQLPGCVTFGVNQKIGAFARLLIHLGEERPTDPDNPAANDAAQLFFATAEPVRTRGELLLLAPGAADPTAEPDAMLSFVRYGGSVGQLSATAVSAGLWPEVFDTASPPRLSGESLSRDLSANVGGATWNPTRMPTPLLANDDLGQANDAWASCSFPRPWRRAPASPVVVVRLERTTPATLQLNYRGESATPISLDGWRLKLDDAVFDLSGELSRETAVFVELDPEADGCVVGRLCWQDAAASVGEAGELSLFEVDGGTSAELWRQHFQWGTATRQRADDAVAAGVWPLADCDLPSLSEGRLLVLDQGEFGDSPADYR